MRGDHVLLIAGEPDGVGEVGRKPVAGEQQRRGDQQDGKRRDRDVDDRGHGCPGHQLDVLTISIQSSGRAQSRAACRGAKLRSVRSPGSAAQRDRGQPRESFAWAGPLTRAAGRIAAARREVSVGVGEREGVDAGSEEDVGDVNVCAEDRQLVLDLADTTAVDVDVKAAAEAPVQPQFVALTVGRRRYDRRPFREWSASTCDGLTVVEPATGP